MDRNELYIKAESVITDILGNGAFIFADPLPDKDRPDIAKWDAMGVSLSFTGPHNGILSLWTQVAFLRSLSSNMLGIEDGTGIPIAQLVDALKEILNMIVGNLLTEIYSSDPVFDLGLPQLQPRQSLAQSISSGVPVWFSAEGEPILFIFSIGD